MDGNLAYVSLFVCFLAHQAPLRHHSGHFRHKMALLWDPHPQYEFAAFGRHFHLILAHDSSFVHPDLQVSSYNSTLLLQRSVTGQVDTVSYIPGHDIAPRVSLIMTKDVSLPGTARGMLLRVL